MLVSYIRNAEGKKCGVVVALSRGRIGWSKCNLKKDRFNKAMGKKIAEGRANLSAKLTNPDQEIVYYKRNGKVKHQKLPPGVSEAICRMQDRAQRYFKTKVMNY